MKKVLIITYYWPPAGGPGVQRVLKFAKYLPQFGWDPVILTVENGEYPAMDRNLLQEVPPDCDVFKTKSIEPFSLYKKFTGKKSDEKIPTFVLHEADSKNIREKLARAIRMNLFVPDAKIGWIPSAVKKGTEIIKEENIELIFSSSPPHSVQLIAEKLARRSGLKWVADFRDPWTDAFWQSGIKRSRLAKNRDKKLEKKVLSRADVVIGPSQSIVNIFRQRADNQFHLISNGFDAADFSVQLYKKTDSFRIRYIGHLGKEQRISNFLRAVADLTDSGEKIELSFFGSIHSAIYEDIQGHGLEKIMRLNGYTPHRKALDLIVNSELLLLVIPDVKDNYGIVTGKLFEYLATGNYILGIGPSEGDAAKILRESGCGEMYSYTQDLRDVIHHRIEEWKRGQRQRPDAQMIEKYSRRNLTARLAEIFDGETN